MDPLELAPQDPPRVEEVVADRGFAATQDLRDLARLAVLHLAQNERRLLFAREPLRDPEEESQELALLGRPDRLGGRVLLAAADQLRRRPVRALPASGAAQVIDGEIRRDPVDPRVEGILVVVAR